jgi:hypothetical protein
MRDYVYDSVQVSGVGCRVSGVQPSLCRAMAWQAGVGCQVSGVGCRVSSLRSVEIWLGKQVSGTARAETSILGYGPSLRVLFIRYAIS